MKKNKPTIEEIVKVLNQEGWKLKKYRGGYGMQIGAFGAGTSIKIYSERELYKAYNCRPKYSKSVL